MADIFPVTCMICETTTGHCEIEGSTGLCDACLDEKYGEE